MIGTITAGFHALMEQGPMAAHHYLVQAIKRIDQELGDGYAKKHPELIGAFIQAAAQECTVATHAQQVREGLERVAAALEGLNHGPIDLDNVVNAIEELDLTIYNKEMN